LTTQEDPPAGYMIVHHRAAGSSSLYFGPFAGKAEIKDWAAAHPDVTGAIVPLYRTVDWSR